MIFTGGIGENSPIVRREVLALLPHFGFSLDEAANEVTIRGKESKLNSPIEEGAISQMMCHYANISYRIGKSFDINPADGHILDKDGMKLWSRTYQKGWEPKL